MTSPRTQPAIGGLSTLHPSTPRPCAATGTGSGTVAGGAS